MNCFTHSQRPAVGMCAVCQRGLCHDCIGVDTPRLLCQSYAAGRTVPRALIGSRFYGFGFEYKSSITVGGWPLVHIASGYDPATLQPRIARGVLAIGNIAIGGVAVGGLACGLITLGGASIGLLAAVGGAAIGLGLSVGGLAVGSIAIGGAAIGFVYAIGGAATAPAVIDATHCDEAVVEFARRWFSTAGRLCR